MKKVLLVGMLFIFALTVLGYAAPADKTKIAVASDANTPASAVSPVVGRKALTISYLTATVHSLKPFQIPTRTQVAEQARWLLISLREKVLQLL